MANWISRILRSFEKSYAIRRISNQIDQPRSEDPLDLLRSGRSYLDALSELWDLVERDTELGQILRAHGADRGILDKLFYRLQLAGAGQWVSGHYVSVSIFAIAPTLDFILRKTSRGEISKNEMFEYAYMLVDYFKKGRAGLVD